MYVTPRLPLATGTKDSHEYAGHVVHNPGCPVALATEKASMSLAQPERRKMPRLPLEVLVRVRLPQVPAEIFGESRNVSAGGIFFVTRSDLLEEGQELECILVLPEKLTMAHSPIPVTARGRVLRIHRQPPDERVGVALEISSYDFSDKHQ